MRTVCLANRRKHFTHGQKMLFKLEMTEAAQAMKIHQAAARAFDAFLHKGIGQLQFRSVAKDFLVDGAHFFGNLGQGIAPGPIGLRTGVKLIDACFARLFVFEQKVGKAAICRNDKDTIVKFVFATIADQNVVHDRINLGHRRTTDLVNAMPSVLVFLG